MDETSTVNTVLITGCSIYISSRESVLGCVLHALESKVPKNHYPVTFPTKLFGILCRILPSSWMDNILSRADKGDKD